MDTTVPSKVYNLIKQVINEDIKNYSISIHDSNKKGEGFLGELCYLSLQDKKNEKTFNLVVKQAFSNEFTRETNGIRNIYLNEIYFYTKVWPCFEKFQKVLPSAKAFTKIVKCLGTTTEEGFEKIVLENLKFQNFQTIDKRKPFDKQHTEYILKEYGKFHALSFAYRALNPEAYANLAKGMKDIYANFTKREGFSKGMHELCLKSLQPREDDKVIEKYKYYVENGNKIFADSNDYKGKYSVILHGDCWSNNMMFKYDESGKIADIRFLDFQLSKEGTPISDLAYFLYAGGSKEIFDQLDYYLKVYHNSLLETVEAFGVNSEEIYPFEVLKREWKQHCQLGFTMALIILKLKLTADDEAVDLTDFEEDDTKEERDSKWFGVKYDEITFKKLTRDLVLHMYKNNYLINE